VLPTVHTAIPECVLDLCLYLTVPDIAFSGVCTGFFLEASISLSLSLSGKEILISKKSIRQEQTAALHALRRSHAPPSQARENEYPS